MKDIVTNIPTDYNLTTRSFAYISEKSARVICINGNCYFAKKTNINSNEKYRFLETQKINNVLYPVLNKNGQYTSESEKDYYYIMPYQESKNVVDEVKINHYYDELSSLHLNTYYRKELTPINAKKKLENVYYYLDYKFNVLETFVRNVESNTFDEYSILILKNYQYILTTRALLAKYNKLIIDDIKSKKMCNRSFIHNNPKLNHLVSNNGMNYFISLERSKIGVPSLDMAKFYIETEDYNINHKELIDNYFKQYDDEFYYNYFYFLVMIYYVKSIVITDKDYVSSQSFVYAGSVLKKFHDIFNLSI